MHQLRPPLLANICSGADFLDACMNMVAMTVGHDTLVVQVMLLCC